MSNTEIETFDSVWDAIADTPAEAVNLKLRSKLMEQIGAIVAERDCTQREAAALPMSIVDPEYRTSG